MTDGRFDSSDRSDRSDPALRLAGATNFRSLGGLPAAGGRRIRPHVLMRADRLTSLTADDWQTLAGTGVATICDLRSDSERAEHPNRVPPQLALRELHCDIRNDLRADPALARLLVDDPTARGAERVMIEIYRRFPAYMGGTLATLVDRLLAGGAPLLVHCSAGKDRTGFIVAMLLHALEVPEELIRQDYLASRTWPGAGSHRGSLEARLGAIIPPHELAAAVDTVLDVRDVYLDAAMDTLQAQFGSVLRYLETAAGVDAWRIDRLRNDLLE
jgi:protein-tyrosine phosphatase